MFFLDCFREKFFFCFKQLSVCQFCVFLKQKEFFFKNRQVQRVQAVLEFIYADIAGKFQVKLLGGAEYYFIFTDDFSRYIWVFLFRYKNDVFECIEIWIFMV